MQNFDVEYDVVVVGGGGSGKIAALCLARAGLNTVIIEKMPETGGTSVYAEGTAAFESSEQKKRVAPPDPKYHFPTKQEAYAKFNNYSHCRANFDVIRAFVDNSADTIDFLKDLGVVYKDVCQAGHDDPNELWCFHLAEGLGAQVQEILLNAVEKAGIDIFTNTPAKELIREDGKVIGIIAEDKESGEMMHIGAKAVILATGGIGNSPEMVAKYTWFSPSAYNMTVFTPLQNVGDGLKMALEAGVDPTNIACGGLVGVSARNKSMDSNASAAGTQPNLWVNKTGRRFANEGIAVNISDIGPVWAKQPDGLIYSILSEADIQRLMEKGSEISIGEFVVFGRPLPMMHAELDQDVADGVAWKADTISDLAKQIGLKPEVLEETVEKYNHACDTGYDEEYFKPAQFLRKLDQGPFYAISMAPGMMSCTGGIRVNGNMQAVNKDYEPIPGLYAVGLDAAGLYGDSYNMEVPGAANGFTHTSGRIAARHIIENLKA